MIQEEYVSFETAKLLKENGFDEVCLWAVPNSVAYEWYKRHGYTETNEISIIPNGDNIGEEGSSTSTEPLVKLKKELK